MNKYNQWKNDPARNKYIFLLPVLIFTCVFFIVVLAELSGTSSGMNWYFIQGNSDPRLLSGQPRTIRSDEWMVQQSWVISQFNQGFPLLNSHFPGGMDMSVFNDLPVWDWSTFFRPHTWGYLFLGLNKGISWYWWFPALAVALSGYFFVLTQAPTKILMAILLPVVTLLSPFVQWWYQPTTLWAFAWVYTSLTCLYLVVTGKSKSKRLICASLFGYFSVVFALEIYVPFIVPAVFIFIAGGLGILFNIPTNELHFRVDVKNWLKRLLPLLISTSAALAVIVLWFFTRAETIKLILNTVYPGQRRIETGSGLFSPNADFISLFGGIWSSILKNTDYPTLLGTNPSEASSALPIVAILLPCSAIVVIAIFKRYQKIEWPLLLNLLVTIVFLLFLYLPNWDVLAHLTFLDLVPTARLKIGFAIQIPITIVFLYRALFTYKLSHTIWLATLTLLVGLGISFPIAVALRSNAELWLLLDSSWKFALPLFLIGLSLLFILKLHDLGLVMITVASFLVAWGVNPLYSGIYNLTDTNIGKSIQQIDEINPGTWVGVGGYSPDVLLTQTGVTSYSGVQNYPIYGIWDTIDTSHQFQNAWNRLGHIRWELTQNQFLVTNPQPDVISVYWNPCKPNQNLKVDYVISDFQISQDFDCLRVIKKVVEQKSTYFIYEVK